MNDDRLRPARLRGWCAACRLALALVAILPLVRSAPAGSATFKQENGTQHGVTAEVTTYEAPTGVTPSPDYRVQAAGHEVFVHGTPTFSLAAFAFSGEVEVTVTVQVPIQNVVIRPAALTVAPVVEGGVIRFRLNRPCHLSIEVNNDLERALFLFADPPETDAPRQGDANVRYFTGGQVHEVGEIQLHDGETLYLAGGAVVRGVIRAEGISGARVLGRGILDATERTTKAQMAALTNCRNVEFNGPIFLGSYGWTLVPRQCEDMRFVNVKVLSWRDNDDGLDVVSSRRVLVDNCFFRPKDDCIAVKSQCGRGFVD